MSEKNPKRNVVAAVVPPDGDDASLSPSPVPSIEAIERALVSRPGKHIILVVTPVKANPEPSKAATSVKVIWQYHPGNQAQRTLTGYRLALQLKGDLILGTSSDWTPSPQELHAMLDRYELGARVVTGFRPPISWDLASGEEKTASSDERTSQFCNALSDRMNRKWARLTTGSKRKDPATPIRLYDLQALQVLLPQIKADGTPPEATLSRLEHKAGFSIKEVAVSNWKLMTST